MAITHPINRNLTLIYCHDWRGVPLPRCHSPYIQEYLIRSQKVIDHAVGCASRVTAVRCDLRLPAAASDVNSRTITKFLSSLKAKIEADQCQKAREGRRFHRTPLSYIWVKERCASSNPHYHCCLLLSGHAYHHLGNFSGGSNMAARIIQAWASALGLSASESSGLVHFPQNAVYHINRNSRSYPQAYAGLITRISYFAKAATKPFGDGSHHFGCSRSSHRM